jgi:hypothetical protein
MRTSGRPAHRTTRVTASCTVLATSPSSVIYLFHLVNLAT